jgi:hypothetical protein
VGRGNPKKRVSSLLIARLTVWYGFTRQEQHKISDGVASNTYRLTQMLPLGAVGGVVVVRKPVLVKLKDVVPFVRLTVVV